MASVTLTLIGRSYKLECADGEEHRLVTLVEDLQTRVQGLARDVGPIGIDRLLLMTALMINDELFDTRAKLAAIEDQDREIEDAA